MSELAFTVVIPAYQAAPWIANIVARTRAQYCELLVIDDGSTDGTGDRARAAGARVVAHAVNRGKGAALATAAKLLVDEGVEAMVTLDADGQHLPEEIPRLVERAVGADLVLGVRDHLFAQMSRERRLSNSISSRLISVAVGESLSDIQTGFRLYRRELLEAVGFRETGFDAESAVVVRAARRGFRIATVPVQMGTVDGRGTSHYRALADSLRIARAVFRARFESGGRGRVGRKESAR